MRLEDAIKQTRFESEYMKLALNIIYTANYIGEKHERIFKDRKITSQQYNVLRILRGQYPKTVSVGTVSSRMLDRSSNVTRLVDKLIQRNMVTRQENPQNRRVQLLGITEEGLKLLEELDPLVRVVYSDFEIISEEKAKELNDLLDKLKQ